MLDENHNPQCLFHLFDLHPLNMPGSIILTPPSQNMKESKFNLVENFVCIAVVWLYWPTKVPPLSQQELVISVLSVQLYPW